jgi:hypothetical protein
MGTDTSKSPRPKKYGQRHINQRFLLTANRQSAMFYTELAGKPTAEKEGDMTMKPIPSVQQILQEAKNEREDLCARLERINDRLRVIDGAIEYFEDILQKIDGAESAGVARVVVSESARFKGKTAVSAAETVLREYGKPMHMDYIVREVLKGGYDAQRDPKRLYSNLFTTLSRRAKKQDVFTKGKKPATFGLLEWESQGKLRVS